MLDEENFFIIDSNCLDNVNDKLYGYAIYNGKIITNEDINGSNINLTGDGAYVYVYNNSDSIVIEQDFLGSWGLYVYESSNGEDYVISNSFAKLVDYLKGKYEISFNKRFAESLLFAGVCSLSYDETLVDEIKLLPRYYKLVINKKDNRLNYIKLDYEEDSVDIDSKEGIELLDKWYYKWISIIRHLREKSDNISLDLSGGFDSRMSSALWLSSDINFDNLNFHSIKRKEEVFVEDFEIASQIADEFNLKLNNRFCEYYFYADFHAPLINALNLKLGATNASSFRHISYKNTIYKFSGYCGETVRGHPNPPKFKYMANMHNRINKNDYSLFKSMESIVFSTLDNISEDYNVSNSENIILMHYKETRNRYHFGKLAVELYLNNVVTLIPLMDADLHKLKRTAKDCGDSLLLATIILLRYCPKLLDFKFEGSREINKKTIEFAKEINEKYPFIPHKNNIISQSKYIPDKKSKSSTEIDESKFIKPETCVEDRILKLEGFLDDVFSSDMFEEEFVRHFSSDTYYAIQKLKRENNVNYLHSVFASISCLRVIRDVEENLKFDSDIEWLESFLVDENESCMNKDVKGLLTPFATARINIKNNVELFNVSDKHASIYTQRFKSKNGIGAIIESYKGKMNFDIKCINSGKLTITLHGKGIRDKNNNMLPTYIEFNSFKINSTEYIEGKKVVSSDDSHAIELDVDDGEILNIHAEWTPFNRQSTYDNKMQAELDKTKKELSAKEKKLNEIDKELEKNKKELNSLLNSKSMKITKPLRKIVNLFRN